MVFNLLSTLNEDDEDNEEVEDFMSLIYSVCAFAVSISFVIGGAVYYVRGSRYVCMKKKKRSSESLYQHMFLFIFLSCETVISPI